MKALKRICVIICFVFFAIVFALMIVFLLLAFSKLEIKDKSKYLKTDGWKSNFILFPDTIDDKKVIEYHYIDYHLRGGAEVFLQISYNENEYNLEKERLENITYGENNKKVIAENEMFNFSSVIAQYAGYFDEYKFEYCLFDDEKHDVYYIYFEYEIIKYINFNIDFLPKNYYIDEKGAITSDSLHFNVYRDYN